MSDIDFFAIILFEESKRFLEKASETDDLKAEQAYLHAALLIGISSFEAFINAIASEMAERNSLGILDLSILNEKDYGFEKGEFKLKEKLKMYNLVDRVDFIIRRFPLKNKSIHTDKWYSQLTSGIKLRNSIVHPKQSHLLSIQEVSTTLNAVINSLDDIYLAMYGKHFPAQGRRLDSTLLF
ncbi:hypothetical protein SDC9_95138 [bioreactor metagenome]|uniref:RiboL-PSP-HEPN domain-containing protein n=1 Tax=bioreactor metagenome TaxID=1076179 RepID=A0A645AC24_9ZZZZ